MNHIFYIQYEVKPLPYHIDYLEVAGAYVNCFIYAESASQAEHIARQNFIDNDWEIVALEKSAQATLQQDFSDEWLEYYNTALQEGECYVYHEWSNE